MDLPRQVFVLEDDPDYRASLIIHVRSAGIAGRGFASAEAFFEDMVDDAVGVVLLDLRLPGMNGLEAFHRLCAMKAGQFAVIVVTGWGDVATAVKMMREGALDFLEKPVDAGRLLADIQSAFEVLGRRLEASVKATENRARLDSLTRRERQVFDLLIEGKRSKEIGLCLGLSPRTIEIFRTKLMKKLGAGSIVDLVKLSV